MCNNYLEETAIKIYIRFSVKTYNNLKTTDMIVYKMWIAIKSDKLAFSTAFSLKRI